MSDREPVQPRMAATVLLLRERPGLEVLLLKRRHGEAFAAGKWVFPGGVVDEADRSLPPHCHRLGDLGDRCARMRATPEVVRGWHAAAVREAFEESGILLAHRVDGGPLPDAAVRADLRRRLVTGSASAEGFASWLLEHGLAVDLDALTPLRRWTTPRSEPRRFDTLFLLADAPEGQDPEPDGDEMVDARWLRPADALAASRAGDLPLIHPTIRALTAIADGPDLPTLHARSAGGGPIRPVVPHVVRGGDGRPARLLMPSDEDYPMADFAEEYPEWQT